ncbi:MAG: acyltransferase [Bacteroidota bacterium]
MITTSGRLHYLDSLRGIAALLVVFYHLLGWHYGAASWWHLTAIIINGADAVSFFFVLSGLVLALPYFQRQRRVRPRQFIWRRIWRLFPAFILTIALNFLAWHRVAIWKEGFFHVLSQKAGELLPELAMILNHHLYYAPGWTLGVEFYGSLLVLALVWTVGRNRRWLWAILLLSLVLPVHRLGLFITHFTLGVMLAAYWPEIKKPSRVAASRAFLSQPLVVYFVLPLVFLSLFSFRHLSRLNDWGLESASWNWLRPFCWSALAATLLLYLVIQRPSWQRRLEHPWLLAAGRWSYGIYLTHWLPVALLMGKWEWWLAVGGGTLGAFLLTATISLAATLASAALLYRYVELPFIHWSKHGALATRCFGRSTGSKQAETKG